MVYFGLFWFVVVYFGLFWFVLVCFGLLWFVLVCFGLFWFGLGCFSLFLFPNLQFVPFDHLQPSCWTRSERSALRSARKRWSSVVVSEPEKHLILDNLKFLKAFNFKNLRFSFFSETSSYLTLDYDYNFYQFYIVIFIINIFVITLYLPFLHLFSICV